MKNILMERPLLSSVVRQKVDNNQLCLSDLVSIYENERVVNNWVKKDLSHFFNRAGEMEYVIELLELQGSFIKLHKHSFIEQVNNQGLIKSLKSIGEYSVTGRGDNKATFCNPYVFIAIAQWLNPRFRAVVTMWATDTLILNRIEVGHDYTQLSMAISEHIIPNISDNAKKFIYSNFAKLLNKHVFGKHDNNLRQIASKEQLRTLNKIQTKLTTAIELDVVKTYSDAKQYLETLNN